MFLQIIMIMLGMFSFKYVLYNLKIQNNRLVTNRIKFVNALQLK